MLEFHELINHGTRYPDLIINTDGGSRGNPGPAAVGVVISTPDGHHIESYGRYLGETTNNQAEYTAVVDALEVCAKYQPTKVTFVLDSELVVKQLNGLYKVKNAELQPLHAHIHQLVAASGAEVAFTHVLRAKNRLADIEVNRVLDAQRD